MLDRIKDFLWVKLGITFEGSPHSLCTRCNRVIFCPRTGIQLDSDKGCDMNQNGKHEELQIECTCKGKKGFYFDKLMSRRFSTK